MRGKWCVTHLRAKQMQNSAREKYKNMENEKSIWCNRQAGQWSNWWRIVCPRLWQKLWTKIFFRRHFLKFHVLPVPIMCPSCQLQWIFFSRSASELKIPLLKGFVPPTHFQKQVGWWNWLGRGHFHERVGESPGQDENFGANAFTKSRFVPEIWPFEKKSAGTKFSQIVDISFCSMSFRRAIPLDTFNGP